MFESKSQRKKPHSAKSRRPVSQRQRAMASSRPHAHAPLCPKQPGERYERFYHLARDFCGYGFRPLLSFQMPKATQSTHTYTHMCKCMPHVPVYLYPVSRLHSHYQPEEYD
jgi:hypothetical protein